ncbi:MAG: TlyA family RNA methyltransferase [Anaerolineales bacterium]|nr:TlyA family RNA methyltransferase [Anaerolineales bacterium]
MSKKRIDLLLVERGLVESRALAQRLVMAGQVRANGEVVGKPSDAVLETVPIEVESGPPFVSRGGEKLAGALAAFPAQVAGKVCADVGASTGGFTDCLLQNGAAKVYAIDVGHGILHWKLRNDPRVVVMERTNARHVEHLLEPVHLVTVDASFISLKILLPVLRAWFVPSTPGFLSDVGEGEVIALIKPQFEAGRKEAARGEGVIRDPKVHRAVLEEVLGFAQAEGFGVRGAIRSPLEGPKGNVEFLAWLGFPGKGEVDLQGLISPIVG